MLRPLHDIARRYGAVATKTGEEQRKTYALGGAFKRPHNRKRLRSPPPEPQIDDDDDDVEERLSSDDCLPTRTVPEDIDAATPTVLVPCSQNTALVSSLAATLHDDDLHAHPSALGLSDVCPDAAALALFCCRAVSDAPLAANRYLVAKNTNTPHENKAAAMREIAREKDIAGNRAAFVPLWARQLSTEGAQDFIVAGYEVFWEHYRALPPAQRVHYEMIHADALVKPFTDYDADPAEMTRQEFEFRVSTLNAIISEQLVTLYGVRVAEIVRLNSSDASKLSAHCVWVLRATATRVDGMVSDDSGAAYFRNVAHLKEFMRLVALVACRRWPRWTVETSRNVYGILDMAVYKAGAYRLYGSTKLRQNRFLFDFGSGHSATAQLSRRVFAASLVQHVARHDCITAVLECALRPTGHGVQTGATVAGSADGVVLLDGGADDYRRDRVGINALPLALLRRVLQIATSDASCDPLAAATVMRVCKRWHEALTGAWPVRAADSVLAAALASHIASAHPGGRVRMPARYSEGWFGRCYVFNQDSRECELNYQLKGRAHLRNSIYWVCLVDARVYYHKCHDADCKETVLQSPLSLSQSALGGLSVPGRGTVHDLPDDVLFCLVYGCAVDSGPMVTIRRLYDNSTTVLRPGDAVTIGSGSVSRFTVREVDEDELHLVCDATMEMLVLRGPSEMQRVHLLANRK